MNWENLGEVIKSQGGGGETFFVLNGKLEKQKDKSGLIPFSFWEFMSLNLLWFTSLCS